MTVNIGSRIIIAFGVVLVLMTGLAFYQLMGMTGLRDSSEEIVEFNLAASDLLSDIRDGQGRMRMHTERAVGARFLEEAGITTQSSRVSQQNWELQFSAVSLDLDRLSELAADRAEESSNRTTRDLWREIAADTERVDVALDENSAVVSTVFDALNTNQLDRLRDRLTVLDEQRDGLVSSLVALQQNADELGRVAVYGIDATYEGVRRVFFVMLTFAFVVALAAIWVLHRSIAPALTELVSVVEQVGRGDLTQRARVRGRDELGRLAGQFNDMIENLSRTTRRTIDAVSNVGGATSQLRASAVQQSSSANEQLTAIQEITTTLNEIAQSGSQISERAREVANSSETTLGASQSGLQAVSETYLTMGLIGEQAEAVASNIVALTEKTRSVGDIITTVNDIAERSDLLALNAAIEASAAGEHGKSFAIVADEMKNLASQAKQATVQVQSLLGDIQQGINTSVMQTEEAVKRAETGKEQSERMKAAIESLAESIDSSIQTFEQIVAGTNQQQIGVEQVTQAVDEIRKSSGQIAEGTRGLEGATVNLNALSEQLQDSVREYVVA